MPSSQPSSSTSRGCSIGASARMLMRDWKKMPPRTVSGAVERHPHRRRGRRGGGRALTEEADQRRQRDQRKRRHDHAPRGDPDRPATTVRCNVGEQLGHVRVRFTADRPVPARGRRATIRVWSRSRSSSSSPVGGAIGRSCTVVTGSSSSSTAAGTTRSAGLPGNPARPRALRRRGQPRARGRPVGRDRRRRVVRAHQSDRGPPATALGQARSGGRGRRRRPAVAGRDAHAIRL